MSPDISIVQSSSTHHTILCFASVVFGTTFPVHTVNWMQLMHYCAVPQDF